MTHTFIRYSLSIALGLAIALPLLAVTNLNIANAQVDDNTLSEEDLLPGEFQEATGLGDADLMTSIGNIINVILMFLGVIAVVIVLIGGFKWMTAGGSDEKVADAKKLLIAGVIGLAIVLSAYAITSFVLTSLIDAAA